MSKVGILLSEPPRSVYYKPEGREMQICNHCEGSGFLNLDQIDDAGIRDDPEKILIWIRNQKIDHDVSVCDCCGDGEGWYGERGEHYNGEELEGVYDYNGGLCECN